MAGDVAAKTIAIIAEHAGCEAKQISRDTELGDIGLDSLGLTEVVMDLEDRFDIDIDLNAAEAWERLKNVGNIVDAIGELVAARR